jgi:hypothetical protein
MFFKLAIRRTNYAMTDVLCRMEDGLLLQREPAYSQNLLQITAHYLFEGTLN